ncbi:MAG TPA: sigma-54 dependent transcriptional regulator [Polyangiaceae bacterium]|nr:sigma-54 dependent transcriptional regulator [Polyangiaceae bacterium]
MSADAPALLVTADKALAGELSRLLAARRVSLQVVGTKSADVEPGGADLVFIDVSTEFGLMLVKTFSEAHVECAVLAVAPAAEPRLGLQAARSGATDFVRYPFDAEELSYVVGKAQAGLARSADEPPPSRLLQHGTQMIAGAPAMSVLLSMLKRAANGTATVLVRGESGSGKELVARQVHESSPRRAGPFVKVHCGALPDNLLESELFGYERGAFTGATARKPGRVDLAEGGTLFLDEIGDITPAVQIKLLRLLQERQFERLGGTETITADVRFVAATHRDLEALAARGEFREDLFYRLNVVSLWVPPLRERKSDVEALALHFCAAAAAANGRVGAMLDADALDLLAAQPWPGNVRQLQNFIERLVVLADNPRISKQEVAAQLGSLQTKAPSLATAGGFNAPESAPESTVVELEEAVRKAEKRALEKALHRARGNRSVAARLLGISRRTLYNKLEEHQLE